LSARQALSTGAFLHDIGKISMNNDAAGQGGKSVSPEESALDHHPDIGARMILPFQLPKEATRIIAHHHERFDGSGYPKGLQGATIPLLARIVGIAQAFDHLTVATDGRQALSFEAATEQIERQAGVVFDPRLSQLFIQQIHDAKLSMPPLMNA
jgi:putative nucleotidyltransferase with HDIG domain